jgi:acetyl esterase/lipase
VIAISGVYDVSSLPAFRTDAAGASPMRRIAAGSPPFLVAYCQNDYATLPAQARAFHAALEAGGLSSELVFVPGKNHITEMVDIWQPDDPTARAMLRFMAAHP